MKKDPRQWEPALCHQVARSNTGIPGVTERTVRGRNCFSVHVRRERGKPKATTVYYGRRGVTREMALERAKALRFEMIGARLKEEGRIVP